MNPDPGCAPEFTTHPHQLRSGDSAAARSRHALHAGRPASVDLTGTITQITPGSRVALASGEAQVLPGMTDTAFADVAAGPGGAGGQLYAGQYRGAVRLHRQHRPEQPPLLLLGDRVRRELPGLGALQPRVGQDRQTGDPAPRRRPRTTPRWSRTLWACRARPTDRPPVPSLDPANGTFSGPFPPANGAAVELVGEFPGVDRRRKRGQRSATRQHHMGDGLRQRAAPSLLVHRRLLGPWIPTSHGVQLPLDFTEEIGCDQAANAFAGPAGGCRQGRQLRAGTATSSCQESGVAIPGTDYLALPGRGSATCATAPGTALDHAPTTGRAGSPGPRPRPTRPWRIRNGCNCTPNAAQHGTLVAMRHLNLTATTTPARCPG